MIVYFPPRHRALQMGLYYSNYSRWCIWTNALVDKTMSLYIVMFCAKLLGSQLEHAQKHRLPIKIAFLLMSSPAYDLSGSLYGLFPIGPSFLGIAPSLAYRWTCIAVVAILESRGFAF